MSYLLPLGARLRFYHAYKRVEQYLHFSAFYARRCSSNFADARSRAFRSPIFYAGKVPTSTIMHSMKPEPTTLTLVGTISTYYSIGGADYNLQV